MKPCSAYCLPDEGRHTFVDYVDYEALGMETLGWSGTILPGSGTSCLPVGTKIVIAQIAPAVEAPPASDERFPVAVLLTVEVLS